MKLFFDYSRFASVTTTVVEIGLPSLEILLGYA